MNLAKEQLKELCRQASDAAIQAGEYIQSKFDKQHNPRFKKTGDTKAATIVTEVDLKAQELILTQLSPSIEKYDLGVLTEESEDDLSRLKKHYFWSVDPMDATLAFVEGRTGYAVSISLVSTAGDPVIGVVYVPDLSKCYTAIKGGGVLLNNKPFLPPYEDSTFNWYMDKSLQKLPDYKKLVQTVEGYVSSQGFTKVIIHDSFGSVRNAIGVLESANGLYFKFPKETIGGGCIWDYAATRLFFEELSFWVSDAGGQKLSLNDPETRYMNQVGVIFTSYRKIAEFVQTLSDEA